MLTGALVVGGFAPASAAMLDTGIGADRPATLGASVRDGLATAISPLEVITTECGSTADCARLTITNSVVGGTATASDWTLKAVRNNASADEFAFTSGQLRTVPRNQSGTQTTYTLSATPVDSALASRYTTTFACTVSSGASQNVSARTVTYGASDSTGPTTASRRNANCTFTHTYQGASVVIDARVLRKESTPADLSNPAHRVALLDPVLNQFRPFPTQSGITAYEFEGESTYHSMQLTLSRQASSRLQYFLSYTLGRARGTLGDEYRVRDPFNPARTYGTLATDRRHIFNISWNALLPDPVSEGGNPIAKGFVNGWQLSGVVRMRSGNPLTPMLQTNRSRSQWSPSLGPGTGPDRPSYAPGRGPGDAVTGDPNRWFDASAFALPEAGTFGNVGRN